MAAAVYVTHRVLPLDHEHFGRLPAQSLRAVDAFVARAERFITDCADRVPFMLDEQNGASYIDRYFEFLARRIETLLPAASRMAAGAARNCAHP